MSIGTFACVGLDCAVFVVIILRVILLLGLHIISPNSKGLFSKVRPVHSASIAVRVCGNNCLNIGLNSRTQAIMESNPTGMLFHTIPQGQVYGRTFCDVTNCTTGKNQCSETCLRRSVCVRVSGCPPFLAC